MTCLLNIKFWEMMKWDCFLFVCEINVNKNKIHIFTLMDNYTSRKILQKSSLLEEQIIKRFIKACPRGTSKSVLIGGKK